MNHFVRLLCVCIALVTAALAQIQSELHLPPSRATVGLKDAVHTIKLERRIITIQDDKIMEDRTFSIEEAIFDLQGRMIEFKDYPERGVLRRWSRYEYKKQTLQSSSSDFYDREGKLYRKSQYEYDESVGIKRQINFDYDDNGVMFRKTVLTREPSNGAIDVKEYKTDGTLIKRNFIGNHFAQSGQRVIDDSASVPVPRQKKILPVRKRSSYDEVDAHGNWTKMSTLPIIHVSNECRTEVQESLIRTITYYSNQ